MIDDRFKPREMASGSLLDVLRRDFADSAISAPLYHQLRRHLRRAVEGGLLQVVLFKLLSALQAAFAARTVDQDAPH